MRIGIDARELCGRSTGVGRYLAGLLREWEGSAYARRHEFVLYTHEPLTIRLDARRFPAHLVKGGGGTRWEQIRLPIVAAKDHLDLFFAPAYSAPLIPRVGTVVAVHDISFVAHPEWFSTREGVRRRWLTRRSVKEASLVITISEFSRRELIERLSVPDSRIRVIPPGIDSPQEGAAAADPAPARDGAFNILFVGSIFGRRHVPDLVRAFAPVARALPGARLHIAGDNRTYPRENVQRLIDTETLDGRVRWHQYVDEQTLEDLYRSAQAFAFLSEYEGLGLTPLEALSYGVPPLLLDTPVARESCGNAACYVPLERPLITAALTSLLVDEDVRSRILAAAPDVLARYDWRRAARETLAAIEAA